jgi:lipopolysaccharide export system permease protein
MRKLDNYIARTVVGSTLMVLLVIVALIAIADLIDELGKVEAGYNFVEVLFYVGLSVPSAIYEQLPFAALVGCLVGLGILANASELVVMRAAGISVGRITWAVMKPALGFIVLGILLGEYVTPFTDQMAESRKAIVLGDKQALESRHGLWNREGNEYMHFNAVLPNGKLYGVTRYQFDQGGRLLSSSFSESAIYQNGYWFEEKGKETHFNEGGITLSDFSQRRWDTKLSPNLLNVLVLNPDALSVYSLYTYSNYLSQQGLENKEYRLAFWKKLMQPLATASLVIIAISFVFGPLREVTMGFRIFTGVIVGIVFQTSQDLLGPSSLVFGFPPILGVSIPLIVCFLIGFLLLRRAN